MLEITNVHKTFNKGTVNEKKALNGIDLYLEDGDFVTVIGGNGAGKSTMLNMIAGVYPIDEGHIVLDNTDISRKPEHVRAKLLGRVFQDPMMGTAADMEIEAMSCMEAFAGGLVPVIANSKKSATPQFALDERSLFKAGDSRSLAEKIDYWIEHEDERRKMEYAYSNQACVSAAETMFETALRERRHGNG